MKRFVLSAAALGLVLIMQGCAIYARPYDYYSSGYYGYAPYGFSYGYGYWPYSYYSYRPYYYGYAPYRYYGYQPWRYRWDNRQYWGGKPGIRPNWGTRHDSRGPVGRAPGGRLEPSRRGTYRGGISPGRSGISPGRGGISRGGSRGRR